VCGYAPRAREESVRPRRFGWRVWAAPQLKDYARALPVSLRHPLLPVVAMVAITAIVWARLYVQRIGEMRRRRIPPGDLASSRQAASALRDVSAADNFRNLFEIPVLFYVFCGALYATQRQDALVLGGCWLFVTLRAVHSAIHCTYNNVMHRFYVYLVSTVLLFALWVWFGIAIIAEA